MLVWTSTPSLPLSPASVIAGASPVMSRSWIGPKTAIIFRCVYLPHLSLPSVSIPPPSSTLSQFPWWVEGVGGVEEDRGRNDEGKTVIGVVGTERGSMWRRGGRVEGEG